MFSSITQLLEELKGVGLGKHSKVLLYINKKEIKKNVPVHTSSISSIII